MARSLTMLPECPAVCIDYILLSNKPAPKLRSRTVAVLFPSDSVVWAQLTGSSVGVIQQLFNLLAGLGWPHMRVRWSWLLTGTCVFSGRVHIEQPRRSKASHGLNGDVSQCFLCYSACYGPSESDCKMSFMQDRRNACEQFANNEQCSCDVITADEGLLDK